MAGGARDGTGEPNGDRGAAGEFFARGISELSASAQKNQSGTRIARNKPGAAGKTSAASKIARRHETAIHLRAEGTIP
jgi:hypothetical protein